MEPQDACGVAPQGEHGPLGSGPALARYSRYSRYFISFAGLTPIARRSTLPHHLPSPFLETSS